MIRYDTKIFDYDTIFLILYKVLGPYNKRFSICCSDCKVKYCNDQQLCYSVITILGIACAQLSNISKIKIVLNDFLKLIWGLPIKLRRLEFWLVFREFYGMRYICYYAVLFILSNNLFLLQYHIFQLNFHLIISLTSVLLLDLGYTIYLQFHQICFPDYFQYK